MTSSGYTIATARPATPVPDGRSRGLDVTASAQLLLALASGALLSAGYALHPIWWAPWLVPVLLLLAASGTGVPSRAIGAIAGAVAVTSVLGYYLGILGWESTLLVIALRAASWMLAVQLTNASVRHLPPAGAIFVLPATMSALELLTLRFSPHGAAGSLANSQMDMLGVIQIASVGGVCAVVFLVLLPGSFVGVCLLARSRRAGLRAAGALTGLIIIGTGLFSAARIRAPQPAGTMPVTLIATNQYDRVGADWTTVWATYRPAVIAAATRGGLVVLPEKVVLLEHEDVDLAVQDVLAAAHETGAAIVIGLETHDHGVYSNRALLATPDGGAHWYDKQRLVPGWEARDTPGDSAVFVEFLGTRLGIAICKDMHIPAIGQQYAGNAAVMVVPAYDFSRDGWMGARMTALRAVENGYAIARSARNGLLSAYDRTGRVILERPVKSHITVATTLLSTVGVATIYARVGDIFGWLCVTATVMLWIWLRLACRVVRGVTIPRAT